LQFGMTYGFSLTPGAESPMIQNQVKWIPSALRQTENSSFTP
jgi:hypothetical protein